MIFMVSVWNRVFQHYTKTEISNLTGVSVSSLSQAQKKNSSMQAKHALVIARHMGVSVEELLTGVPSQGWHRAHDDLAEALTHAKQVVERLQSALQTATLFVPISSEEAKGDSTPSFQAFGNLEHRPKKPERPGATSNTKPLRSKLTSTHPDPDGSRSVYESAPDYSPPDHEYIMVTGMTAAGMPIEIGQGEGMVTLDKSLLCGDAQEHYAVQVRGTSMTGAGIQDGDYCLIYSASVPVNGQIMLARHGDRLTLKLIREDPQSSRGRRYHLHYVDGSGREVLADEDGEDWYSVGKFVCTFVPLS